MKQKSLRKNSIYSIVKSCSIVLFPLITFPYISRVLQPENVGKYNFSHSIVSYFSMLASLGVTTYAVRECAKNKDNKTELEKISSQIISINIVTTMISYLLLILTVYFVPSLKSYTVLIAVQSLTILFTTLGADWINTAMEDFQYISLRTVVTQFLSLVLMFIFVKNSQDYIRYAAIMTCSVSGANLINIFYRRKFCRTRFTLDMDMQRHLPPIMGLFAMIVAQQVFTMSDTTMIGFFCGDYEVGLYSTAIKVYNIVNQLVASITWVVMPQLSIYFSEENFAEIKKVLKYSMNFIATLGIPCVIGIFMLSPEIIMVVGGQSYLGAEPVLRILALTLAVSFVGNFVLNINILSSGKDKVGMAACAVPAIFNLITNFIFIPLYGIQAAAWTTVVSQLLVVLICIPYLDKRCEIGGIIKQMWRPALAGVILMVVCMAVFQFCTDYIIRICLCILLGGISYIGILIWLKDDIIFGMIRKFIK